MTENAPRRRRTEAETVQAMFDTALDQIQRDGLSIGVHDLSFEAIIERAGVARSAVYRRWSNRDDFYRDLLVELIRADERIFHPLPMITFDAIGPQLDAFDPAGRSFEERRAALIELCRVGAATNDTSVRNSDGYRTHVALVSVIQSSQGEFRTEALRLLKESEERFRESLCQFFAGVLEKLGLRLRPGVTLCTYSTLVAGLMEGIGVTASALAGEPAAVVVADPFGLGTEQEWTTASIGFTALTLSLVDAQD